MLAKPLIHHAICLPAPLCVSVGLSIPAAAADDPPSVIQLGPSQARIIDLPRPAGAVIVAEPTALSALLDSPQRLVLIPQRIAATSLTVLDQAGRIMLGAEVMISGRQGNSLRMTRGCTTAGDCLPSTVEVCADDCVTLPLLAEATPKPESGGSVASQPSAPTDASSSP